MGKHKYQPTEREQLVLDAVENPRYDRQIVNGLEPFMSGSAPEEFKSFYTSQELADLQQLRGTERDVEARMPVKLTRHYFEMATSSSALQRLVKASPDETVDLEGDPDPANQLDYSPIEGLLHKYEMGLLYVISTCSAHCRFCYREELIGRKEIERADGTLRKKGLANVQEIGDYIRTHNDAVARNGGSHPETGRPKLREILLSGGDPMVLPNSKLAGWFTSLAEAGTEAIRVGTKELAFYPDRFDDAFFAMIDRFHEAYPDVAMRFMIHFNHPDEFLVKDPDGRYVADDKGFLRWRANTRRALDALVSRGWISVENQTPIIAGVNDDAEALRILQRTLKSVGVENHYFFCGRNIVAYKAFNVPIERAWQLLNESQRGLSGVESHARLTIVHYKGKTEVSAVTDGPIAGLRGAENGVVIFKVLRNPAHAPDRGKVTIVGRNPEALWFDEYEDRVLLDEAGLFSRQRPSGVAVPRSRSRHHMARDTKSAPTARPAPLMALVGGTDRTSRSKSPAGSPATPAVLDAREA